MTRVRASIARTCGEVAAQKSWATSGAQATRERIAQLHARGLDSTAIARELGVDQAAIRSALSALNASPQGTPNREVDR